MEEVIINSYGTTMSICHDHRMLDNRITRTFPIQPLLWRLLLSVLLLSGCTGPYSGEQATNLHPSELPELSAYTWAECSSDSRAKSPRELLSQSALRFIASHRGKLRGLPSRQEEGENSIRAIEETLQKGILLVEIDLRMTPDGELFLFHDRLISPRNSRTPLAWMGRDIDSIQASELDQLELPTVDGQKVPRFAEALKAIKPHPRAAFLLDIKGPSRRREDLLKKAAQIAQQHNALRQIIIQCQGLEELQITAREFPDIARLARLHSPTEVPAALGFGPLIVQGDKEWMSRGLIDSIHKAKAKVLIKTLDSEDRPQSWQERLATGADILLSDRGNLLLERACGTQFPRQIRTR